MKKILLLALIGLFVHSVRAQEIEEPALKHEFGIHLGATTGMGLSYRHWFGKTGIQITALPIKTNDYTLVSAGFSFLQSFYESRYSRFYGYLGTHYWNNRYESYSSDFDYNSGTFLESNEYKEEKTFNLGIGPAFAFGKRVRFNIMAGYGFYDVFGKFNMYPTGEIGLYYCF